MKIFLTALFSFVLGWTSLFAHAQSAPTAYRNGLSINVGGEASLFQPDYAGGLYPATSPNRLYGVGAYVDVKFTRWVQLEAEGRWLHFNETYTCAPGVQCQNGENNYLIGPRIPIHTFRQRYTPYGKALVGLGSGNNIFAGHTLNIALGGGLDYRLNRRFTLRAIDFEYQDWRVHPESLHPYGGSVGISYRIF
jgi:hypothetical protein